MIHELTEHVLAGGALTRDQAEKLLRAGEADLESLLAGAGRIRERYKGRRITTCSIAATKVGACSQNCAFCSQSVHYRTHVTETAELEAEQVFQAALNAADSGARCFGLVNSGLGPGDAEIEKWAPVIERIVGSGCIRVCASLGLVSQTQARRLAACGVTRYNLNLQTSDRFFNNIISTHTRQQRIESLMHLRAAGIDLCCGALFGMGEQWSDRLDVAFDLRKLEVRVVPLNFLIPIDGTPLADRPLLPAEECLTIIAMYRYLLPQCEIKVAGGREKCLGHAQERIFDAGADSFLIGNYLTTCGRPPQEDLAMIERLGLSLGNHADAPTEDVSVSASIHHAS